MMKKRDFKDWEYEQINDEFGYIRHYEKFEPLETWLKAENPITDQEFEQLKDLSKELLFNAEDWNEDELKFLFLSPLIKLVDFRSNHYKVFTQRKIAATIGEWEISGIFDFVVSRGKQRPKQPYFFIHEYKSEKRKDNDPLGQLLAEIIVVQQLNDVRFPIYGCYIVGRYHFFVVMNGKEYAVSKSFDSTDEEDIRQIFKLFRFVKHEIDKHFE
jgi:hypothetical protein